MTVSLSNGQFWVLISTAVIIAIGIGQLIYFLINQLGVQRFLNLEKQNADLERRMNMLIRRFPPAPDKIVSNGRMVPVLDLVELNKKMLQLNEQIKQHKQEVSPETIKHLHEKIEQYKYVLNKNFVEVNQRDKEQDELNQMILDCVAQLIIITGKKCKTPQKKKSAAKRT